MNRLALHRGCLNLGAATRMASAANFAGARDLASGVRKYRTHLLMAKRPVYYWTTKTLI